MASAPDAADPRRREWEDPEQVAKFADKAPDKRLAALLETVPEPERVRVLDLGCAGGRNAELLAARGFDLHALDLSAAMVARTRARLALVLASEEEASRRVVQGEMRDLSRYADGRFDLVVAIGVLHTAQDEAEWHEALGEVARVLTEGGRLLVSNFAPGTGAPGAPLPRVPGTVFVHEGFGEGRMCLRTARELDADFARLGLHPDVPTEVIEREEGDRRRVTVNALYRKTGGEAGDPLSSPDA